MSLLLHLQLHSQRNPYHKVTHLKYDSIFEIVYRNYFLISFEVMKINAEIFRRKIDKEEENPRKMKYCYGFGIFGECFCAGTVWERPNVCRFYFNKKMENYLYHIC